MPSLKRFSKAKPPQNQQPESESRPSGALLFGADADLSIVTRASTKALDMFEHERPDDARRPDESKDITSLPLAEIGRRLQYYTGMLAYAQVQLARQDQTAVACEYHHDVLKKQRMVLLDSGQQKYKLEATVTSEPTIQKAYQAVLEANAARAMFKAVVDGLKAKADLYSREVTRRGVEA